MKVPCIREFYTLKLLQVAPGHIIITILRSWSRSIHTSYGSDHVSCVCDYELFSVDDELSPSSEVVYSYSVLGGPGSSEDDDDADAVLAVLSYLVRSTLLKKGYEGGGRTGSSLTKQGNGLLSKNLSLKACNSTYCNTILRECFIIQP